MIPSVCDAPVELPLDVVPAMVALLVPDDELELLELPVLLELEFEFELVLPLQAAMVTNAAKTISASPILR